VIFVVLQSLVAWIPVSKGNLEFELCLLIEKLFQSCLCDQLGALHQVFPFLTHFSDSPYLDYSLSFGFDCCLLLKLIV
jgi:hypothetical protein